MLEYMPVTTAYMCGQCARTKDINVEVAMNTAVQWHEIQNLDLCDSAEVMATATK